jgi:hypothetical protein
MGMERSGLVLMEIKVRNLLGDIEETTIYLRMAEV